MTNKVLIKQELTGTGASCEESDQVLDLRKSGAGRKAAVAVVNGDSRRHPSEETPPPAGSLGSCTWCGKKGDFKDAGAPAGFCSSVCFDQYRRDCFKKRSACIWCSASASRQNLISNASSVDESKFCSPQCLAQFKVRVFCEETTAHLDQLKDVNMIRPEVIDDLITPELWLQQSLIGRGQLGKSTLGIDKVKSEQSHKRTSSSSASIPSPMDLLELAKKRHLTPKQDYRHQQHHQHLAAAAGVRRRPHRSNHGDRVTRSLQSPLDKHDDLLMPLAAAQLQRHTNSNSVSGGNGKHREVLKQMENGPAAALELMMRQSRMSLPNVPGIDSLQLLNPFTTTTTLSSSEDSSARKHGSWNQRALMRGNLSFQPVNGTRAEGANEISRINYASPGVAVSSLSPGTKAKEGPDLNATVISLSGCHGRNNDILYRKSNGDDKCNRVETNFMSNSQCYPILLPIPVPIPIPIPIFLPQDFRNNFFRRTRQESESSSKKAGTSEPVTDDRTTKTVLSNGENGLSKSSASCSSSSSEKLRDVILDEENYD